MVVVAEKLELDPSLKLETRIASAILEVDMPGTADEPLRSKPAAVAGRVATLGFKHAFAAGAGTNLHAALAAALQSDDQADSEIPAVRVRRRRQGRREGARDGGGEPRGAAREGRRPCARRGGGEGRQGRRGGPARGGGHRARRAPRDRRLARELGGRRRARAAHAREATEGGGQGGGAAVLVEVDVLGAHTERTPRLAAAGAVGHKGVGTYAISSKQASTRRRGARAGDARSAAADEQTDSEVQFAVLSVDAKGEEKELGVAAVSLEALLETGADHALGAVAAKDNDGKGAEVGQLAVAVTALAAAKQAQADARDAAEAAAVGKVGVKLDAARAHAARRRRLRRRAAPAPSSRSTCPAPSAQRTPNLQPHGDGKCAITFKQSFDAASGSKARKAIAARCSRTSRPARRRSSRG